MTIVYPWFIHFAVSWSGFPGVTERSKNALDGDIIRVSRGVAIYKTHASPYWNARVRDPATRKYVVRSTRETSRLRAREVAEEIAADLTSSLSDLGLIFCRRQFCRG